MLMKIVIDTTDNTLQVAVPPQGDAAWPAARAKLERLVESLGLAGIKFDSVGEIEQHTHGPDALETVAHVHAS